MNYLNWHNLKIEEIINLQKRWFDKPFNAYTKILNKIIGIMFFMSNFLMKISRGYNVLIIVIEKEYKIKLTQYKNQKILEKAKKESQIMEQKKI